MYCVQLKCIVDNWNILCVIMCLQMAGFMRNSADFSFKASGIRVVELSVNLAELSMNAVEFWFSARFLFLSHVKRISAEFY
jgi:hypothetical protein